MEGGLEGGDEREDSEIVSASRMLSSEMKVVHTLLMHPNPFEGVWEEVEERLRETEEPAEPGYADWEKSPNDTSF